MQWDNHRHSELSQGSLCMTIAPTVRPNG